MKNKTKFGLVIITVIVTVVLISGCLEEEKIWISDEWNTPVNLGEPINTLKWEDAPSISPDGNILYFTIGKDRDVDSFFSIWIGNNWTEPQPHNFNLENFPDGAVHSQDNNTLYFSSIRPGGYGEGDIYIYENNEVKNIGQPINTEYMESEPYISSDGKTLYFASNRPDGLGGADIWFSRKIDGNWQEPENLDTPVNSKKDETQPFLTQDGKKLYFTAINRKGVGGPAIFKSVKQGDSWSDPEKVVTNFVGEPTLTADDKFIYFVHIFVSKGKLIDADIYVAERKIR